MSQFDTASRNHESNNPRIVNMQQESLKNKTVKGTLWSAADSFLGHGVTFFVGIILARLLSPDEYGLIGICLICNTVLNGIVDSGFSSAIIRKKEASEDDYNTMFITNMVVSILLYFILFLCTPIIADFFGRNELVSLIRVTGSVLIINALSITQTTILTKRIDFKTKTKASIISAVVSGVIGIAMAYYGFGVWALAGQLISKQLLYTCCLWILNKWWPNLHFSIDSFKYMWGFGWKILVSGLLNNIWEQIYQVVVGKFYNPATLGQYTRGRQFASIFSENFTVIIKRVSYPVLANIQDDTARMVAAYRKVIKVSMFVTVITLFSLGAVAEPLLYTLIGDQWHEAAVFLPFICISMSLYPLHALNLNMLQVQGRSDVFLYLEIIKKIISIGPICLGIFVGIKAMLIGSIVTGVISFFLNSYYTGKELQYSSWMQIKDVSISFLIATILAVSVYFLKYLSMPYWTILISQIVLGSGMLLLICELCKVEEYLEIKRIAVGMLNKHKRFE